MSPRRAEDKRRNDRMYKANVKARRVEVGGVLVAAEIPVERHGLVSTYRNYGCRCSPCRASIDVIKNRRVLVDGVLIAPVPTEEHGRESTYKNHYCRCAECTEANQIMAQIRRGGESGIRY